MGFRRICLIAVIICVLITFTTVKCSRSEQVETFNRNILVTTTLGKIRGTTLESRLGKSFYAFRGIRYAKPPVGDLRFQEPEPVEPWSNTFDATDDGPMCPQPVTNISDISEDCLRLNVYTRKLPSRLSPNVLKPVILYFHPGGFYLSSALSKNAAGPEILMDRDDIVLVTSNYRLGTLGFLATGTKDAPGNAGFKDQVMAMKWVQEHISKFGGDPNCVTLMGYSAGALSITLHLISPMSRNLFHKAIVMSSAITAQWQVPTDQLDLAKQQASLLNCPQEDITYMVQCLKQKKPEDFVRILPNLFDHTGLVFKPVIEKDFGQTRFLVQDPTKAYQQGDFMKVPIIAGITKDEFGQATVDVLINDTWRTELDEEFEKYAPMYFLYERDTRRSRYISKELRTKFLNHTPLSFGRSLNGLHSLFSDSLIGFNMHRFVHLASKYTTVYYYRFSFQGRYSYFYYPDKNPFGVVHMDDLLYLFRIRAIAPLFTKNDPEDITVERMTRMWTNFVKTSNPNNFNDEYLFGVNWIPFNERQENYLDIGDELVLKRGLYLDRYTIWDRLFPLSKI